jgi:hypothetical protein
MPKNRSRFALLGLAFILTLPVFACDSSGDAGKKVVIDTETKPSAAPPAAIEKGVPHK